MPFGILLDLDHTLLHTCTDGEEGAPRDPHRLATQALASLIASIPGGKCTGGALDIVLHPSHPRLRTLNPPTDQGRAHHAVAEKDQAGFAYVVVRPYLFQFLCYLITAPHIAEIAVWSAGGCEYVMSLVEKILLPLLSCAFDAMHPAHRVAAAYGNASGACSGDGPHRYAVGGTNHGMGSIVVYTGGTCGINSQKHKPPKHLSALLFQLHRPRQRWILLDDIPENVGLQMDDRALSTRAVDNGGLMWIPPFHAGTRDWLHDRWLLSAIGALHKIKNAPNGVTNKKNGPRTILPLRVKPASCRVRRRPRPTSK
jgi:hypothetical protein